MSRIQPSTPEIGTSDVGFGLVWLLALLLLVPTQLASIIVFDTTGVDALVPDPVFVAIVPAFVLTLLTTVVARRLYTRRTIFLTAAVAFVGFAYVATYTKQIYAMCGPGC